MTLQGLINEYIMRLNFCGDQVASVWLYENVRSNKIKEAIQKCVVRHVNSEKKQRYAVRHTIVNGEETIQALIIRYANKINAWGEDTAKVYLNGLEISKKLKKAIKKTVMIYAHTDGIKAAAIILI